MSPRTNESAPESGHGDRPKAEPPKPPLRAVEASGEAGATGAWAGAVSGGAGSANAAMTAGEGNGSGVKHAGAGADGGNGAASAGAYGGSAATGAGASSGSIGERCGSIATGADEYDESAEEFGEGAATHAEAHVDAPAQAGDGGGELVDGESAAPATTEGAPPPPDGKTPPSPPDRKTPPSPPDGKTPPSPPDGKTPPSPPDGKTPPSPPDGDAPSCEAAGGGDERVVAVRRFAAAGRRWRVVQLGFCAASLAVALTAGAVAVGAVRDSGTAPVASAPAGISPELLAGGDLDSSIRALQAHLRAQPRDYGSWATLGLAYVEQARTKGDPSRYPQAQSTLDRSLELRPDNDAALAGRAALAAARHDFTDALKYADLALQQNPYSERALSSRIDALVELGRYADASKAADLADSRHPGVPVFTRYAYVHELRGDVNTARRVLEQALASATSRGDIAYVATALAQLAWSQGDYGTALTDYARALAADDTYLPALEGRARAQAAQGDTADAIRGMEQVVDRYPLPQPLVELGELYEARGKGDDLTKAHDQYALVDAWVSLARANGVNADLDTALAAADHGDRTAALKAARAEWARRHTVHTADALAWALHVNGRDQEALPYARQATATGYRNAAFLYHRGMIERAAGHPDQARASLTAALGLNSGFSPLGAREARKALEAMK
ncbi:tetratricopeptide repeat protein [Streptomyces hygroscopicus]|uniref:tetratricopeptide repeat protein n=1 Tax=Streptomyces hygroscopicus TaxID=1912 RepID=UPI00223F20EC|nr:tetratricopeptide repeat protein [Streptomyces hygroscopicus]